MSINKANLKKLLTPIIKECVKEALSDKDLIQEIVLSSGVLSTVVKEIATGLNESRQPVANFSHAIGHVGPSETVVESRKMREQTRSQVSSLPAQKPKPTTEFEKTHHAVDKDYQGKRNTYGALAGSDPSDGGISLAAFGLGASTSAEINESRQPKNIGGVDISELTIGSRLK
tara:strand:+ start:178 stop:696 length:519 start_codon:yes stop_codon:yes gene_type:complete